MHGPQTQICLCVLARDTQEFRLASSMELCLSTLYAQKTESMLWPTVELCTVPHIQAAAWWQIPLNTCSVEVTSEASVSSFTGASLYSYAVPLEVRWASYLNNFVSV